MLSEAEEQAMHLARGGGGLGAENFLYGEEDHAEISETGRIDRDRLEEDHTSGVQGPTTYFAPELLMAHRDPMLDADLIQPRNHTGYSYSRHDPVIGSYGSHDPAFPGQSQSHRSSHVDQIDMPSTSQPTVPNGNDITDTTTTLPPMYQFTQPNQHKPNFDFLIMEEFAAEERRKLDSAPQLQWAQGNGIGAEIRRRLAQSAKEEIPAGPSQARPTASDLLAGISQAQVRTDDTEYMPPASPQVVPEPPSPVVQRRKLSLSNMPPRRQGKLAMFEGGLGPFPPAPPSAAHSTGVGRYGTRPQVSHRSGTSDSGTDRPYRFSFYSNALAATIHARSLYELPSENQSFEDFFMGRTGDYSQPTTTAYANVQASGAKTRPPSEQVTPRAGTPVADPSRVMGSTPGATSSTQHLPSNRATSARANILNTPTGPAFASDDEYEKRTWWLDILSPTDDEMKMLSRVRSRFWAVQLRYLSDILCISPGFLYSPVDNGGYTHGGSARKDRVIPELLFRELFPSSARTLLTSGVFLQVCFRGFDQDVYSPTHLEPLNMYVIVFREGILSVRSHHISDRPAASDCICLVPLPRDAAPSKCAAANQTTQRLH